MIRTIMKKTVVFSAISGLLLQLVACGTIMHPERKGQKDGQLDTTIVAFDAIGLLFFLVPGVIAFAVDFSNGTIYLPGGSAALDQEHMFIVRSEEELTKERIEQLVEEHTGKAINLDESSASSTSETITISAIESSIHML